MTTIKSTIQAGLADAIIGMKEGGRKKVIIPSWLMTYKSYDTPEEYLEKMLLMAMFRQFNQMCNDFQKQITTCNDIHRTMLYLPQKDGTYPEDKHTTVIHQFTLFGTPHLFIGQNGGFTQEELLKIQRSVIDDKRKDLQKALMMLSLIFNV